MKKNAQVIMVVLLLAPLLSAAEQQNAAELYEKAFALCSKPNNRTRDMLKFKIGQSDPGVSRYVEANRHVIDLVVQGGQMENCDWQMSSSEFFQAQYIGRVMYAASVLIADAGLLAEKGDYDAALERASAVRTMAERLGGVSAMLYTVRIRVDSQANDFIQDLLSNMPADKQRLLKLQKQFEEADSKQPAFEDIIRAEEQNISSSTMPGSERFPESAIKYWKNILSRMYPAAELPYPEAQKELEKLKAQAEKDVTTNPDALIAAGLVESQMKMHSLCVRHQTHLNATRAAIEIYMVKAETGSLPEKLPEGLPKDLFSGQDFDYQKTDGGFNLRCRGREVGREDLWEFEFKIAGGAKEGSKSEPIEIAPAEGEPNEVVEEAGEKEKGPVLEEVLAAWEAGEQDKAMEEFLKIDWRGEKVFAGDSVLDVNQSDYDAMSVEEKKQVRQDTVELMKTVRQLTKQALDVGSEALSSKEFEKAEVYFVAVDKCAEALSPPSALASRKTVALGIRRAALMKLTALYGRTGEEVKLGEVKEALRRL